MSFLVPRAKPSAWQLSALSGVSRVGRERFEHDRKSNVPVILYAEFTAKPGSESQVQVLISDLAEKVRQEPE